MIHTSVIGEVSLNLSMCLYVIWFLPQLWLNFQRKNTDGLSLWMHGLLFLGYSADFLYGFGRHMPWQYRVVTVTGLLCLSVEHFQFMRFGLYDRLSRLTFLFFTTLILLLVAYAFSNVFFFAHQKKYYDVAGFVSNACWATYLFPQMIKNFRLRSTNGLSIGFVEIAVLLSLLDLTSAIVLKWDLPSLINPFIGLFKKSVLVFQVVWYRSRA